LRCVGLREKLKEPLTAGFLLDKALTAENTVDDCPETLTSPLMEGEETFPNIYTVWD
jgi:hypothetical protein